MEAAKSQEGAALMILALSSRAVENIAANPQWGLGTPCPSDLDEEIISPQTSLSDPKGQVLC